MRILNDRHLTATDRKAIAAMRANGWTQAKTPRINYRLDPDGENWRCTIEQSARDDSGRPITRLTIALLAFPAQATGGEL